MLTPQGPVRIVMLQFSFTNIEAVPALIRCIDEETPEKRSERKSIVNGVMMIPPTEHCSVHAFAVKDLWLAGYELVDAFYEERIDPRDQSKRRKYHVVRFTFAHSDFVNVSEQFKAVRPALVAGLQQICSTALWRVRAFSNPFFNEGEEVEGQRALSLNLEVRVPLFRPDGSSVTVWRKDEQGERVGEAPLPLRAQHELRVVDESPTLVACDSLVCS